LTIQEKRILKSSRQSAQAASLLPSLRKALVACKNTVSTERCAKFVLEHWFSKRTGKHLHHRALENCLAPFVNRKSPVQSGSPAPVSFTYSERRRALEGFKRGVFRVLVATDIAARGIDVANIGHVINVDLPYCPEDYVHRIGRTARMTSTGRAISFVTAEDPQHLNAIERLLGYAVPWAVGSPHPDQSGPTRTQRQKGRPSLDARRKAGCTVIEPIPFRSEVSCRKVRLSRRKVHKPSLTRRRHVTD